MCSHYLVYPVACKPASGWERGQVENQVGLVRALLHPTPSRQKPRRAERLAVGKCVAYSRTHRHPEQTERMIWQMFEEERGKVVHYVGPFGGFHCVPARRRPARFASTTTNTPSSRRRTATLVEVSTRRRSRSGRVSLRRSGGCRCRSPGDPGSRRLLGPGDHKPAGPEP